MRSGSPCVTATKSGAMSLPPRSAPCVAAIIEGDYMHRQQLPRAVCANRFDD
jgi:hypothetical protein